VACFAIQIENGKWKMENGKWKIMGRETVFSIE